MLIILSIFPAQYVVGETTYIVTTPGLNNFCPGEFIGEPCLTLQQYASVSNKASKRTTTLILESGTHRLHQPEVFFDFKNVENFTMRAESAEITIASQIRIYFNDESRAHISGITFTGTGYEYISLRYAQEVIIEKCRFQGVSLSLSTIGNAMIATSCFFNCHRYGGAISSYSSTVTIIRCEFNNNKQALDIELSRYQQVRSLIVSESAFINNTGTSGYREHSAVHIFGGESVIISKAIFINNTSKYNGGALYISGSGGSILVNESIFVNNTATKREGGALYLAGRFNNATIATSTFIYNSANYSNSGAIGIAKNVNISLTESIFYYNRANGDGGVACISSVDITVSKSTFVQNNAAGNGGAFLLDNSTVYISSTLFKNNKAGQDGGALATYVYPSIYTIIRSTFIDNHAGDDGGALFIGRAESDLSIERCSFSNNHATDRGGAITLYGSWVDIIATNVYDNTASLGSSMCACDSEVYGSFSDGQGDTTHPECFNYDTNINDHDLPLVQEQGYPDIIHLSTKNGETACSLLMDNSLYGELQKASTTAYTAVTISITLALGLLLYIIITKTLQYRMTQQTASDGATPAGDQIGPLYEEARDYTSSKTDTRDIEMMPNVVYGKHSTN